jgi:hypothetical protein
MEVDRSIPLGQENLWLNLYLRRNGFGHQPIREQLEVDVPTGLQSALG